MGQQIKESDPDVRFEQSTAAIKPVEFIELVRFLARDQGDNRLDLSV
jgi:hypothetical protein